MPNIPVKVVFNGTNSITVLYCTNSYAFRCNAATTFDLSAGSNATLDISGQNTYGIYSKGAVTVNGSGAMLTISSHDGCSPYTIYAANSSAVIFNGGTMAFTGEDGICAGAITLNGVTVPAGTSLSMSESANPPITYGSNNTIYGEVVMPFQRPYTEDDFTHFTGSGTIRLRPSDKIYSIDGVEIHTVGFNSNGGSTVPPITGVASGRLITVPTVPTKVDCVFGGWYKETELINKWDFDTDTVISDITLYAKWLARPTCVAPTGVTAIYGKTLANVILTNPEGNTDGSWSWMVSDPSTTVGNVGTNILKASFFPTDAATYGKVYNIDVSVTVDPKQLTVSGTTAADKHYDGNTDANVTLGTVSDIISGDDVTVTATGTFDTKEEGTNKTVSVTYALTGDDAGNYIAPTNETTTADITAVPLPATYTVTYISNGGSGTMTNGTATQDVAFTLPDSTFTAPTGKQFKEWAIGSTDGTKVAVNGTHTFTANTTVYAVWENIPVITYTVTYNSNGGSGTMTSGTATQDVAFTLPDSTFTAPTGKQFKEWAIGSTDGTKVAVNGSYTFTANTIVYAVWENRASLLTQYPVTKEQNVEWTKGGREGLAFTVNADFSKFTTDASVLVNGVVIASDKYTLQSDSTIITLKAAYLETLSAGVHTLPVNFADGYAETNFTIKAVNTETGSNGDNGENTNNQNSNTVVPQTGDNSQMLLWVLLMLNSAVGIAAIGITQKKRKSNSKQ